MASLKNMDRRVIFLLVGLGAILPIIFTLGLPVRSTPPVENVFNFIDSLQAGDVVMISFDYGPSSAPENDPMAEAVMRHCFVKKIKVVVTAIYPIGGLTMAVRTTNKVSAEFPLEYGVDFVNLGYKDGGQAAMRQMAYNIDEAYPQDVNGRDIHDLELMQNIRGYVDVKIVVSLATGIIGEWWANLVNAQHGVPVAVGPTAVAAPKYYAYMKAGQMVGVIGGLKGASEYEKLLLDNYPELNATYAAPGVYTATKGMDVQSVVHLIIIGFIGLGNVIYLRSRRERKR